MWTPSRAVILVIVTSSLSLHATNVTNRFPDINYWTAEFKVRLSGVTPGVYSTNGVIATTRAVPVRFTSKEILEALDGQLAFTIARAFTNYSYTVTNSQSGPDEIITHYVEAAYPVSGDAVRRTYSKRARLLVLQPLGEAAFVGPMFVIRDGSPSVDYLVDSYFAVQNVSFTGDPDASVLSGKYDITYSLAQLTECSVKEFTFNASGVVNAPTGPYFSVRGYTTERRRPVIHGSTVVDPGVIKSLSTAVSGTGQLVPGAFSVLRGSIYAGNGKVETW